MADSQGKTINRVVLDLKSMPTLPGLVSKLSALTEDNKTSAQEMARIVSMDQVLSAKVLKLVNSAFYGFSRRVSTVSNAIILLGGNVVRSLTISSSIFEIMEKNIVGLWEHSMGVAVAANVIARELKLPEPEETSTAALLHDIGKVILKIRLEDEYDRVDALVDEKDLTVVEAEQQLLGTTHAEIGEWVAQSWLLPEKLVEPIACHHNVERSLAHRAKTSVIHIADALIKASGFGLSGDDIVPQIQPAAWSKLELTESKLASIIDQIEDKLVEVKQFSLEIQSDEPKNPHIPAV
jgi:putative nucleotidyltransferase with HDIG domain